jgi:peptidoglycan-associated lipoprotein
VALSIRSPRTIQKISTVFMTATLIFALGACSSKKKAEDTQAPLESTVSEPQTPAIESTPMSFEATGSDSGKIDGLQTVFFDYDKASLSADSKKKLQGNADWMKSHGNTRMQVEGHTDARGSIEYNLSLGERRAQSVKSYLTSLGIPAARIAIISYGKEKPLAPGDSEADYSKNRRANFVPLGQ